MSRIPLLLPPRALSSGPVLGRARAWAVLSAGLVAMATPGTAEAACATPSSPSELARHVSSADAAFTSLEADTFNAELQAARHAVTCLDAALTPGQAAAYHRVEALGAFMNRDHSAAVSSFKSLLVVAPDYILPATYAPEEHPLRVDFEVAAGLPRTTGLPLMELEAGEFRVDGTASADAPQDRPYILQQVGDSGEIVASQLVDAGVLPPPFARAAASTQRTGGSGGRFTTPLAITAGAAAVVAGGLFLAADGRAATFWDPNADAAELEQLRRQTNTMAGLSVGAGVVAVGAGAAAFATWAW